MAKLVYFIGGHKVESIEMLDTATCVLTFVAEEDKETGNLVSTQVEYWLDEKSWHFNDLWYEADGSYIDSEETKRLAPEHQEQCKEIISTWIENNN